VVRGCTRLARAQLYRSGTAREGRGDFGIGARDALPSAARGNPRELARGV